MLLPGPDLHCAGPLHFGDFRNIFLPNIGKSQKNLTICARGPGPQDKSGPGYCITFIKKLDENLRYQLLG